MAEQIFGQENSKSAKGAFFSEMSSFSSSSSESNVKTDISSDSNISSLGNTLSKIETLHTKKRSFRNFIIIFLIVTIIFTVAVLSLSSIVFLILLNHKIILLHRNDEIFVPDGKSLYDLNYHTFRNGELYRFQSNYILFDENEEFEPISTATDIEGEVLVMTVAHHAKDLHKVKVGAQCQCYEDDERIRRNVGMLYNRRLVYYVSVPLIALAISKFVNDRIDDCYDLARENVGPDVPLNCYFAEETIEEEVEEELSDKEKLERVGSEYKEEADDDPYDPKHYTIECFHCRGTCAPAGRDPGERGKLMIPLQPYQKEFCEKQEGTAFVKSTPECNNAESARMKFFEFFMDPWCRGFKEFRCVAHQSKAKCTQLPKFECDRAYLDDFESDWLM